MTGMENTQSRPDATIFDLAAAILARTGEIATMRLHKLAFYAQAWHLVWDEELLTDAAFFAWGTGPVSPELHATHPGVFLIRDVPGNPEVFTAAQLESIDEVVSAYGGLRPYVLNAVVKSEAPWQDAWAGTAPGERGRIIEVERMLSFYSALEGEPVAEFAAAQAE
ncbi:Panacea domain-containing protein [Arthrobacter methylotrophus]